MSSKADKKAYIVDAQGNRLGELPILTSTLGPDVYDIRDLQKQTGHFAYDPGFFSTASCESKITYVDGDAGILLYRGYRIESLAEHSSFLEVAYLLLHEELPKKQELDSFDQLIRKHAPLHEQLTYFYRGFRRDAHPMAIMVGIVGALSAFYHECLDIMNPDERIMAAQRIMAKMPTIAAMAYQYAIGKPFIYPESSLSFTENFLHMLFSTPGKRYDASPTIIKALDKILILHADHEQNASTSTVRIAASSAANPFACIAAGIASLWGPAHGGANEAVLAMLQRIERPENIPAFLEKVRNKEERLMGFGHRVYKNYDPRAAVLKESAHAVLKELKHSTPLFDVALELERIALEDPYFQERNLFPNVDFYSGVILKALGIPESMFTVLFAVSRSVGWLAQWNEIFDSDTQKISRPRQLYTGHTERSYIPIDS